MYIHRVSPPPFKIRLVAQFTSHVAAIYVCGFAKSRMHAHLCIVHVRITLIIDTKNTNETTKAIDLYRKQMSAATADVAAVPSSISCFPDRAVVNEQDRPVWRDGVIGSLGVVRTMAVLLKNNRTPRLLSSS